MHEVEKWRGQQHIEGPFGLKRLKDTSKHAMQSKPNSCPKNLRASRKHASRTRSEPRPLAGTANLTPRGDPIATDFQPTKKATYADKPSEVAIRMGVQLAKMVNAKDTGFYVMPEFHVFTIPRSIEAQQRTARGDNSSYLGKNRPGVGDVMS